MDSDLKSRADDDMADEAEETLYGAEHTQGNKRRMVAKAKSAPFIANNMDQTRDFWANLTLERRELRSLSRHTRGVMVLLPGMRRDGYLSLGRRNVVLHNWALHTSLSKIKT